MKNNVTIKIKNKNYKFPLGLKFIGDCLENLGLSVGEMGIKIDENPFKWSPILMYESLKSSGIELKFTFDEFIEILDNDAEGIQKIGNFNRSFITTLQSKLPQPETQEEPKQPKKK